MALTMEQQKIKALIKKHAETMPYYVEEYVNEKVNQQDFSINTMLQYLYHFDDFFSWLRLDAKIVDAASNKDIQLSDLETLKKKDVQIYFEKKKEENIATENQKAYDVYEKRKTSSLNTNKSALRSLFRYLASEAEDDDGESLLGRNVMAKFPLTRSKIKTTERAARINEMTLKGDEIPKFLYFVEHEYENLVKESPQKLSRFKRDLPRDLALLHLLLGSGVRVAEAASLEIKAINFKDARISFTRKGGQIDNIHVTIEAILAIEKYMAVRNSLYPGAEYSPFLFVNKYNGKAKELSRRAIQDLVAKYTEAFLGKMHLSPHKLRHSFAFEFAEANGDNLQLLKDQLGHSNIDTSSLYVNKSDRERANAIENLSKKRYED